MFSRRIVAAGALQGERRRGIMLNLAAAIQLEDDFLSFEAELISTQSALVRYLGPIAQSVSDISLSCGLGYFKNSADKCQECQVIHTPTRIGPACSPTLTFAHAHARPYARAQIGTFKDEVDDSGYIDGCQPCPANSISQRAAINVNNCTEVPNFESCGIRCDAMVILNDTDWTTSGYR